MSGMDHYLLRRGPPMELSLPALLPIRGGEEGIEEDGERECVRGRHTHKKDWERERERG